MPDEGTWKAQARPSTRPASPTSTPLTATWIVSEDGAGAVGVDQRTGRDGAADDRRRRSSSRPAARSPSRGTATDDEASTASRSRCATTPPGRTSPPTAPGASTRSPGWYRVSPVNLTATSYNWTYTTPFNLKPGQLLVLGAGDRRPRPHHVVGQPGHGSRSTPRCRVTRRRTPAQRHRHAVTGGQSLHLDLAGHGDRRQGCRGGPWLALRRTTPASYLQPNGTLGAAFATAPGHAGHARTRPATTWTLPVDLPTDGDWNVTAFAVDTVDQQDTSTSGATARYRIYPGDPPPTLTENLLAPDRGHGLHRRPDLRQRPGRGRPGDAARRGRDHEQRRAST